MLRRLYHKVLTFADHPQAFWIMGLISFIESSFCPVPPDPLYIAMSLKQRERTWVLALWCTLTSVAGGILGYAIGAFLYDAVGVKILQIYGLTESFARFQHQFQTYGFWIVAAKGLTPVPYKVVTISCGLTGVDFWTFVLASCIARGFKTFLLAGLLWIYGPRIRTFIERHLGWSIFLFVGTLVLGFWVLKLL